jgi:hypothetical protein
MYVDICACEFCMCIHFNQFKRALCGMDSELNYVNVDASTLTTRTLTDELLSAYDDKMSATSSIIPSGVKVSAKFWNSQTGVEESKSDISRTSKSKHQINSLATSAAAVEVEMARQRQAGYAKRDAARAKYGW